MSRKISSDLLEKSRSEAFDMLLTEYVTEIHERHVFENGVVTARAESIADFERKIKEKN